MTAESNEKLFVQRIRELLVSLPYDLKVLFEAMSDGDLPQEARVAAAGGAIYCLSPSDPIPDSAGVLGFVDDVVVVRLTLELLLKLGGEEAADYPRRFSEQFAGLSEDIALIHAYLGDTMSWLEKRVLNKLHRRRYKGKDAVGYLKDDDALEFLYNEGITFTTDYEIDEDKASRLQNGQSVRDVFKRRKEEEERRISP